MAIVAQPYQPANDGWGTITTKAAGTITAGHMVVLGTDGVVAAADSCTTGIYGIARNSAADGGLINVSTQGIFKMQLATGFDPDVGDLAYVASSSTLDAGAQSDVSVGTVVRTDPASAGEALIAIHCAQFYTATTHA